MIKQLWTPKNLENISNFEGWGLIIVAFKKSVLKNLLQNVKNLINLSQSPFKYLNSNLRQSRHVRQCILVSALHRSSRSSVEKVFYRKAFLKISQNH